MELTPDFSIVINGSDTFPKERVISIRTSDEAGIISDSCEIELDDFDDALQLPKTEAKLELSLGWKDYGVVRIGTYFVGEIFIDGAKKAVRIKANAASKAMRSQKSRANKGGLRDFVDERAGNFGLEPAVSDEIEDIELEDYPQVELRGFPTKIPSKWVISRVEHAVSNNGFSTQVECCSVG